MIVSILNYCNYNCVNTDTPQIHTNKQKLSIYRQKKKKTKTKNNKKKLLN